MTIAEARKNKHLDLADFVNPGTLNDRTVSHVEFQVCIGALTCPRKMQENLHDAPEL